MLQQEHAQNFARLYNDLATKPETPHIADYGVFGEFTTIAQTLYTARKDGGEPGLKAAIKTISNQKSAESRKALVAIASAPLQAPAKPSPKIEAPQEEDPIPPLPEAIRVTPDMTAGLCPLKDAYVAYSKEASPEGYEDFHPSCFWGMASTIAGRRVCVALTRKKYTPLIVLLSARSSLFAKTDTARVQHDVLEAAGLDWMFGLTRTTPQKLLKDMAGPVPENYGELTPAEQDEIKRRLAMSGQRGWLYNEFGKHLSAMMRPTGPMSDFVEVLLQISDCPKDLPIGTIARGDEVVIKPYLAITGTLTPASIKAISDKNSESWNDGFYARFAFSCAPYHGYKNDPYKQGLLPVPNHLALGLREWHNRLGEPELNIAPICNDGGEPTGRYKKEWVKELPEHVYSLSDDAYKAWADYRGALKGLISDMNTTDLDASYARLPDMALSVAALAASLEGASQIEYKHWLLAQEQAESWRESLHRLYAQVNGAMEEEAEKTITNKLIEWIEGQGKVQPRDIVRSGPNALRKMKAKGVKALLSDLCDEGLIERDYTEGDGREWYKLA